MNDPVYIGLKELAIFAGGVLTTAAVLYNFFMPRDKCKDQHNSCVATAADLATLKNKVTDDREEFIEVRTLLGSMKDEIGKISQKIDDLIDRGP